MKKYKSLGVLLVLLAIASVVSAHSWDYKPPRDISTTPGTPWTGFKRMPKPPLSAPVTGGRELPVRAPTIRGTSAGAFTKKRCVVNTPSATWEHWWARNRYRYLNLLMPRINYPVTPGPKTGSSVAEGLRVRCRKWLRPMLRDDSARLRRAAALGLARLHDVQSLPAIKALLEDRNQTVRDSALFALAMFDHAATKYLLLHMAGGGPEARKVLRQSSVPDYFRGFAEISLSLTRTTGTRPLLETTVLDRACPVPVRALALQGLGLLGGEEAVKFLIGFSDREEELTAAAATALGRTGDRVVCPALTKLLISESSAIRRAATLALCTVAVPEDREVMKRLKQSHRHTSDSVLRGFCLLAMGGIGGVEALGHLEHTLKRGRRSDAGWACLGLGLARRSEHRLVVRALNHSNRSTRGAAAVALGIARAPGAMDSLITMMKKGDDPCFRGYCALALGMIGDKRGKAPLRVALRWKDKPGIASQAGLALALLGDRESVPYLLEVLIDSKNDAVKSQASLSLSYMAGLDTVGRLLEEIRCRQVDDLTLLHCIHLATKLLSNQRVPYLDRFAKDSNPADGCPLSDYLLELDL